MERVRHYPPGTGQDGWATALPRISSDKSISFPMAPANTSSYDEYASTLTVTVREF